MGASALTIAIRSSRGNRVAAARGLTCDDALLCDREAA